MPETVTLADFKNLDLRVGEIVNVEEHPNASKLLVLTVDLGEEEPRTIVAGLKGFYEAKELKGKKAIFVANLEPAVLRGVKSEGMILAAVNKDHSEVVILTPEKDMPSGTNIS